MPVPKGPQTRGRKTSLSPGVHQGATVDACVAYSVIVGPRASRSKPLTSSQVAARLYALHTGAQGGSPGQGIAPDQAGGPWQPRTTTVTPSS